MGSVSGSETQVRTSVSSAAALRAVPVGEFRTGDQAAVQTAPGAFPHMYNLVLDSTAADDGVNVINTFNSAAGAYPGRWLLASTGSAAPTYTDEFVVAVNGDTTYTLTHTPTDPANLMFFINGALQLQTTDYTVVGTTLTWLNVGFSLVAGWQLTARYN